MLPLVAACLAMVIALVQPAAPLLQSVDLAIPAAPVMFEQAGRTLLVHELHVTNFQQGEVALRAVAVRDDSGRELARYDGAELARRITRPRLRNDHVTPAVVGRACARSSTSGSRCRRTTPSRAASPTSSTSR